MRFKIASCILLILPVFSFVLAAPVPVQEACEACAAAAEGSENVIIASGKRVSRGDPQGEGSDLYPPDADEVWKSWATTPQSPSVPDHASGSHPGVDMPSSPSAGSGSPGPVWDTSPPQSPSAPDHAGGSRPGVDMPSSSAGSKSPLWSEVWSTPHGTEVPLDTEGAFKPGTTTEIQPASSSAAKSVSWVDTTKVHFPGEEPLPFPPKPKSKSQSKNFGSKIKTFFGKFAKPKFRPRFQRTVDTGILADGNLGEFSNALATSVTDGGAGMSSPSLSET